VRHTRTSSRLSSAIELTTAPTSKPITTEEAKAHIKIDSTVTADDVYIDTLVEAAIEYAQERTRRQFITATYKMYLDDFPGSSTPIELDKPKLQSITSITYVDTNEVLQTWSNTLYEVDTKTEPGRVQPIDGESYPGVFTQFNGVIITFVAGYGGAADVPDVIKHALKLLVAYFYENRDMVNVSFAAHGVSQIPVPMAVEVLLNQVALRNL